MKDFATACPLCRNPEGRFVFSKDSLKYFRCSTCDCIYLAGRIAEGKISELYHEDYALERGYDDSGSSVAKAKARTAGYYLDKIGRYKSKGKLLDIGCGPGIFLAGASRRGWDVSGFDINEHNIKMAAANVPQGHFSFGPFEKQIFPEKSFDVIALIDVIEHLEDPEEIFRKMYRWLSAEGVFFILTPNIRSLSAKIMGAGWPHVIPGHVLFYSPCSLNRILADHGFVILEEGNARKYINSEIVGRHMACHSHGRILKMLAKGLMRSRIFKDKTMLLSLGEMYVIAQKKG